MGFDLETHEVSMIGEDGLQNLGRIIVTQPIRMRDFIYMWNTAAQMFIYSISKNSWEIFGEVEEKDK